MRARVVIATPTTLIAMLRTIAYAWQQEALTEHAQEVLALGRSSTGGSAPWAAMWTSSDGSLRRAVDDYNSTVGSLERHGAARGSAAWATSRRGAASSR